MQRKYEKKMTYHVSLAGTDLGDVLARQLPRSHLRQDVLLPGGLTGAGADAFIRLRLLRTVSGQRIYHPLWRSVSFQTPNPISFG